MTTTPSGPDPTADSHPDPQALRRGPADAEQRLVLLHGWGADADDLLDLGDLLISGGPPTQIVALRAPQPHPGGFGRQWYDLQTPGWPDLPDARLALRHRLQNLAGSLPLERTVVLGFSQGAAMAIDAAGDLPLAGLVACSGYPHEGSPLLLAADAADTPWRPATVLLLTHGQDDPIVRHEASEDLLRHWRRAGGTAELLSFAGGHTIDESVLPQMRDFVNQRLRG
ncbi:MAG: alpha/beta hydrolase [Cyanobacteriota bacterium]